MAHPHAKPQNRNGLATALALFANPLLFAGENLVKNGTFDEGAAAAEHWEQADGLTSFYVTEEGRGRIVKMDTLVDRKQALDWHKAFTADPMLKPPVKTPIAPASYGSIGGNEGVMLDSDFIDCKPGQNYKLTADFRGVGKAFVWIKGFLWHPARKTWVDGYQTRLEPDTCSAAEWHTASIGFNPTARSPRIQKFKVRLYAYWPNGLYYFDNVRVEEITPEEMAQRVTKRAEVK
ncbi:MAG TPA: hypothetical protein PKM57_16060 [Kiritimatiellia bacterium]|nr:hypothetical protein [Kiritimatiellia bacterium]HPS06702.1 hypothetical protein [Kiritimatiellia bacterium]